MPVRERGKEIFSRQSGFYRLVNEMQELFQVFSPGQFSDFIYQFKLISFGIGSALPYYFSFAVDQKGMRDRSDIQSPFKIGILVEENHIFPTFSIDKRGNII